MALITSKARAGIAALTFAAAVAPFVLATSAKAVTDIRFFDIGENGVSVTIAEDGRIVEIINAVGETFNTRSFASITLSPVLVDPLKGGIRFVEPGTNITSDILQVTVSAPFGPFVPLRLTQFQFNSDPDLEGIGFIGFTVVEETGDLQQVNLAPIPGVQPDTRFRDAAGLIVPLPSDIVVRIASDVEVPGPVVGAGLPGLLAACVGLLALARRRRKKSPEHLT